MQRPIQDFQTAVAEKGIKKWPIHDCSMCGYHCGFMFENGEVMYDSGCYCSDGWPQQRSWGDVADAYNRNQPERNERIKPEYVKEMDDFWGFHEETAPKKENTKQVTQVSNLKD